jgi:hypothetical protein
MSDRNVARLAWMRCGLIIIAAVVGMHYGLGDRPAGETVLETTSTLAQFIIFVAFALTGALMISHQTRHMVGRIGRRMGCNARYEKYSGDGW